MDDILIDFESPQPASKFMRWLACFIDYLIYALLAGGAVHFFGNQKVSPAGEPVTKLVEIRSLLCILIPWLVILPGYETLNKGQTIGKAIFGIMVIKQDGSKIDIITSIIRHLFDIIDFLPFGGLVGLATAANNKNAQRIGDRVAKTIVVEARGEGRF